MVYFQTANRHKPKERPVSTLDRVLNTATTVLGREAQERQHCPDPQVGELARALVVEFEDLDLDQNGLRPHIVGKTFAQLAQYLDTFAPEP